MNPHEDVENIRRTICIDFDGVINSYKSGWIADDQLPDPVVPGTRQAIEMLRRNYKVVVLSARANTDKGKKAIKDYLDKNDIIVDDITSEKIPAKLYIDDKAITFKGDWTLALEQINQFKSWTKEQSKKGEK